MLQRIHQWLAPPILPDEEQTRIASLLNLLILAFIFFMLLATIALPILAPETIPILWMSIVVIIVSVTLREVMRRGRVRFASIALCVLLWPFLVYFLTTSGGLTSPGFGFLCIAVSAGVLLFGPRGAILFGVLNIIVTLGLYWAGSQGLLIIPENPPMLAQLFATDSLLFAMLATLVAVGGHGVQDALNRARRGEQLLAERNKELQREIADRTQAQAELQRRDIILEAVGMASSRLLKASDWQQEIGNILGILGKAAVADRAAVHNTFRDGQGIVRVSLKYEWAAPGVSSWLNNPRLYHVDVAAAGYAAQFEDLGRKQPIFYHTRGVAPQRQATAQLPVTQSSLHVPIFVRGQIWGSLHLSTVHEEHEWSKPELEALQIAADMLGAVMERKEAEDALQQYTVRLTILHQIDRAILVAASSQEIVRVALRHIHLLIPYHRATIEVPVFDTETYRLLASSVGGELADDTSDFHPLDMAWIDKLRQDQSYFLVDLHSLPDLPPSFQSLLADGLSGLAAIPLIARGKLLGYLNLLAQDLDIFSAERMEIAREISDQLAIAIQQVYLLETERNQRALTEALHDSTAAMSSTLDLDDVLERILANVQRVVPHDAAHIMLLKDGIARVVCARGWVERGLGDWIAQLRFTFDRMPKWLEFFMGDSPQPYLVDDTRADPDWVRFDESDWIRSAAGAPIVTGGQLIGILHLDSAAPGFFTTEHLDRLQMFANQAAIAIHNAQLFKAERRRRQIAETLVHAAEVLTSTLKLNQVLDLILRGLHDVIDYDSASIQQLENDELSIIACLGFQEPSKVIGIKFPLDPKYPNWRVTTEKSPLAAADVVEVYPHFQQESPHYVSGHVRAWLGLPLLSKDVVVGMISLDWMKIRPFADDEIDLAMAFANQAAVAMENARLYEQTQNHAAELEQRVKDRTAELEAANEELRALSRMKDEFVSNVSHELRTPITNLNLRYHLIAKQPEQLGVHLSVARRETSRLARIIDDLLTLSRMDQERTPFKLSPMDLNSLVQQFVLDRIPQAESQGLVLSLNCIGQPLPVRADAGLLEQALSVLLTNALNYTPSGGSVTIHTQMRQADDQDWAGFSIQDTGPGISEAEQARLFTRFFRGTAGCESRVSGTGLGLAIAREIVTRHHGLIGVESEGIPGQGSVFTVWLPMSVSNQPGSE